MKTKIFLIVTIIIAVMNSSFTQSVETHYFSKTVKSNFEDVTEKVKSSLQEQGFGIITEIDLDKKITEKVEGAEMNPYRILGACNPKFAYETVKIEENIGLFLPCKVVIKYLDENTTEVVMINPSALMKMMGDDKLNGVADEVTDRFKKALDNV